MFASLIMIGSGMTMFDVFCCQGKCFLYIYQKIFIPLPKLSPFLFLCAFNLFNLISTFSWPKGQFID